MRFRRSVDAAGSAGRHRRTWLAALAVAALSVPVGLLTNLVSDRVPAQLDRLALPAFAAAVVAFLLAVAWQTRQSMPGAGSRRSRARRLREKQQTIRLVEAAAREALRETFAEIPRLPLRLRGRPDLLGNPRLLPDAPRSATPNGGPTASADEIGEIFDGTGRSLLLIGAGGAGKSTLLAELCLWLCERADPRDEDPQIPILVSLASWRGGDEPVTEWLCRVTADTYPGVGADLVREWVEERSLVLLLDGLDEIRGRERAVRALDAFLRLGPCPVAVGSRTDDHLTGGTKLSLSHALEIVPLDRREVDTYLADLGSSVSEAVRAVPAKDQAWWAMIGTPMMLGVVARVSASRPDATLPAKGSVRQRRADLIEIHVDALLHRRTDRQPGFPPEDARRWLEWLAEWMTRHRSADFYLDRLPPAWIADVTDAKELKIRPRYWLPMTWTAAIGVLYVIAFVGGGDLFAGIPLMWNGLLLTFATSLHIRRRHCRPDRPIEPVWRVTGQWLPLTLLGLLFSSIGVLVARPSLPTSIAGTGVVVTAVTATLATAPVAIALAGNPVSIPDREGLPPGARVRRSKRIAWTAALGLGPPIALAAGLMRGLHDDDLAWGLSFGIPFAVLCMASFWLIFGGVPVLQYRAFFRQLAKSGHGPADYLGFLDWCRERLVLQAAGSAYRFPHREIQRHLAESWRRNQRVARKASRREDPS